MPAELDIALDRSSPVPLYHQVASAFEQAIREGQLPPETKLQNEIDLAKRYNLSRPTMRQAMDRLVRDGLIVRRRGVGTQVVGPRVHRSLQLSSLFNDLQAEGASPTTEVLSAERIPANEEIAGRLDLRPGTEVLHLRRLRLLEDRPLALMENWLPDPQAVDVDALTAQGLYDQLRRHRVDFHMAHQTVGAAVAEKDQAEILDVETGAPLVTMERTAYDSRGAAAEYGHHLYRADRYSFDITLMN